MLLIALIWGGYDVYARWQERRLVRRAASAFDQGDFRTASLAARTALNLKANSVGASRIMAQIGERTGDRGALDWRRKIIQLQPQSVEDILEWARSAVFFGDLTMAERALAEVPEASRQTAGYHAVSALVAQGRHQEARAETEWGEAIRLAPAEKAYQLQFGISQLRSPNPERHAAGEKALQNLREDPRYRIAATRALITEEIGRAHV